MSPEQEKSIGFGLFLALIAGAFVGMTIATTLNNRAWRQLLIQNGLGHHVVYDQTNGYTKFVLITNANFEKTTQ